jgi:predicted DCC family thiol-disulfide oxidoreductase YuxK
MNKPSSPVLIYDGQCRLCVSAKQGLERLGQGDAGPPVRFVPYQSEEAACYLGMDYRAGRPDVAYLVEPSGAVRYGLDAFLPLLRGLPGGGVLAKMANLRAVRPLAQCLYKIVARNRYRWFGAVAGTNPLTR